MHHLHSIRGTLCLHKLHVGILKRWVFRWHLKSSRDSWSLNGGGGGNAFQTAGEAYEKPLLMRWNWEGNCSNAGERTWLRARAEVVSMERSGWICRIDQMRWLHDLMMEAECSLKLRWESKVTPRSLIVVEEEGGCLQRLWRLGETEFLGGRVWQWTWFQISADSVEESWQDSNHWLHLCTSANFWVDQTCCCWRG